MSLPLREWLSLSSLDALGTLDLVLPVWLIMIQVTPHTSLALTLGVRRKRLDYLDRLAQTSSSPDLFSYYLRTRCYFEKFRD